MRTLFENNILLADTHKIRTNHS